MALPEEKKKQQTAPQTARMTEWKSTVAKASGKSVPSVSTSFKEPTSYSFKGSKSDISSRYKAATQYATEQQKQEQRIAQYNAIDDSTVSSATAKILTMAQENREQAQQALDMLGQLQQDPTSKYYNPYSASTSGAAKELANLGVDMTGFDSDPKKWISDNAGFMQYYNLSTASGGVLKSGGNEAAIGYWYNQLRGEQETTDKASAEWDALQTEMRYLATKPGANLSDDDILAAIDWKKYPTLAKMDSDKANGTPLQLTKSIGYSADAMKGVLWGIRNQDISTGDAFMDAVKGAAGQGKGFESNGEYAARSVYKENGQYNPYYSPNYYSTNMDKTAMNYGMDGNGFAREWFTDEKWGELRNQAIAGDTEAEKLLKAEEFTEACEDELAAVKTQIKEDIDRMGYDFVARSLSSDEGIKQYFTAESPFSTSKKNLWKLHEGLGSSTGDMPDLTRGVPYSIGDLRQFAAEYGATKGDAQASVDYANSIATTAGGAGRMNTGTVGVYKQKNEQVGLYAGALGNAGLDPTGEKYANATGAQTDDVIASIDTAVNSGVVWNADAKGAVGKLGFLLKQGNLAETVAPAVGDKLNEMAKNAPTYKIAANAIDNISTWIGLSSEWVERELKNYAETGEVNPQLDEAIGMASEDSGIGKEEMLADLKGYVTDKGLGNTPKPEGTPVDNQEESASDYADSIKGTVDGVKADEPKQTTPEEYAVSPQGTVDEMKGKAANAPKREPASEPVDLFSMKIPQEELYNIRMGNFAQANSYVAAHADDFFGAMAAIDKANREWEDYRYRQQNGFYNGLTTTGAIRGALESDYQTTYDALSAVAETDEEKAALHEFEKAFGYSQLTDDQIFEMLKAKNGYRFSEDRQPIVDDILASSGYNINSVKDQLVEQARYDMVEKDDSGEVSDALKGLLEKAGDSIEWSFSGDMAKEQAAIEKSRADAAAAADVINGLSAHYMDGVLENSGEFGTNMLDFYRGAWEKYNSPERKEYTDSFYVDYYMDNGLLKPEDMPQFVENRDKELDDAISATTQDIEDLKASGAPAEIIENAETALARLNEEKGLLSTYELDSRPDFANQVAAFDEGFLIDEGGILPENEEDRLYDEAEYFGHLLSSSDEVNSDVFAAAQKLFYLGTEQEVSRFKYVYQTQGEEAAKDYLFKLNDMLSVRNYDEMQEAISKAVNEKGFKGVANRSLLLLDSIVTAPLRMVGSSYAIGSTISTGDFNPYSDYMLFNNLSSGVRGSTKEYINNNFTGFTKDILNLAYDAAATVGDSTVNSIFGGLSAVAMGYGSVADAMTDARARGANAQQMLGMGMLTWLAETGTEFLPMQEMQKAFRLGSTGATKETLLKIIKDSFWSDTAGELINDISEEAFDQLVMGYLSDENLSNRQNSIEKYVADGMSYEDAEAKVNQEFLQGLGYTLVLSTVTSTTGPLVTYGAGSVGRLETNIAITRGQNRAISALYGAMNANGTGGSVTEAAAVASKWFGGNTQFNKMTGAYVQSLGANGGIAYAQVLQEHGVTGHKLFEIAAQYPGGQCASVVEGLMTRQGGAKGVSAEEITNAVKADMVNAKRIPSAMNALDSFATSETVRQKLGENPSPAVVAANEAADTAIVSAEQAKAKAEEAQSKVTEAEAAVSDANAQTVANPTPEAIKAESNALDALAQAQDKQTSEQAKADAAEKAAEEAVKKADAVAQKEVTAAIEEAEAEQKNADPEEKAKVEAELKAEAEVWADDSVPVEEKAAKVAEIVEQTAQPVAETAETEGQEQPVAEQPVEEAPVAHPVAKPLTKQARQKIVSNMSEEQVRSSMEAIVKKRFPDATAEEVGNIVNSLIAKRGQRTNGKAYDINQGEGLLNSGEKMSDVSSELLGKIEQAFGIKFSFEDANVTDKDGNTSKLFKGFVDSDGSTIHIDQDITAEDAIRTVVAHELTHLAETSESYAQLAEALIMAKYGVTDSVEFEADWKQKQKDYNARLKELGREQITDEGAKREVVAQIAEELLSDEKMLQKLTNTAEPNLLQKIFNWIKTVARKISGFGNYNDLDNAIGIMRDALRSRGVEQTSEISFEGENGQQYSLDIDEAGLDSWMNDLLSAYDSGDLSEFISDEELNQAINGSQLETAVPAVPAVENVPVETATAEAVPEAVPAETAPAKTVPVEPASEENMGGEIKQRQFGSDTAQRETSFLSEGTKSILARNSSYVTDSNRAEMTRAAESIARKGYTQAASDFKNADSSSLMLKDQQAEGVLLMAEAVQRGDFDTEAAIAQKYNEVGQALGQALQARKIFNMMTNEGAISYIQKQVDQVNSRLMAKGINVEFSLALQENLRKAKTPKEIMAAKEAAINAINEQIPMTFVEKLNAWRYFAMLFNTKTHARNVLGNFIFAGEVDAKNAIATAIERLAIPEGERTKAFNPVGMFVEEKYTKFALATLNDKNLIAALNGQTRLGESADTKVSNNGEVFNGMTKLGKAANAVMKFGSESLEFEDDIFIRSRYVKTLAEFLHARKADIRTMDKDAIAEAESYAIAEAQKATFHDFSAVAAILNKLERGEAGNRKMAGGQKAIGFFVNSYLPFKKTPVNVLRRGVEYSPIGLVSELAKQAALATKMSYQEKVIRERFKGRSDVEITRQHDFDNEYLVVTEKSADGKHDKVTVVSEKDSATRFIDSISAGLTGTGIAAIGAALFKAGVLTISSIGDDDKEENWKKLLGHQRYALELGGKSYTIDWAAPAAMPFLMGAEIINKVEQLGEEGKKFDLLNLADAASSILSPVIELSMLDGVQNLFENLSDYGKNNPIGTFMTTAVYNYFSSIVPSGLGNLARSIDPIRRTTVSEKTGLLSTDLGYQLQKTMMRIPGMSTLLPAYVDAWGQNQNYQEMTGGVFGNILYQHFSPGYISTVDEDLTEKAITEIASITGNEGVYPTIKKKSFQYKSDTYELGGQDYQHYKEFVGQESKRICDEMTASKEFAYLDPYYQAMATESAYELAMKKGKNLFIPAGEDCRTREEYNYDGNEARYIIEKTFGKQSEDVVTAAEQGMHRALLYGDTDSLNSILEMVRYYEKSYEKSDKLKSRVAGTFKEAYLDAVNTGYESAVEQTILDLDIGFTPSEIEGWAKNR